MKVFLEVNQLQSSQKTGISTYVDNLCRALLSAKSDVEWVLYGPEVEKAPYPELKKSKFLGHSAVLRDTQLILANQFNLGGVPKDIDICHLLAPDFALKRRNPKTKLISTIYDIAFAYYPETVKDDDTYRLLCRAIPAQAADSDQVITISESAKSDIVNILGVDPKKVHVIYPGIDLKRPRAADAHLLDTDPWKELQLPDNYLLCLGTWEPRKNLSVLFKAVALLKKRMVEQNMFLCMSGIKGWKYAEAEELISNLGIEDRIQTLGHVKRELLPQLYAHAKAFVYPSMYEGFGMPVSEALACGTPCITSNTSSLPEAGGDAALLVDTRTPEPLAEAIERVLDDEALRSDMIAKGFVHAAKFTWEDAASKHLEVYRGMV